MKNLKYILSIFIIVFFFSSCEEFLDINDDPNDPANVSIDLRLKPTILMTNGAAQWRGAREIVAVTQYVASRQKGNAPDTWNFTSRNFFWQNALVWSFPNAVDLIVLGEEENSPHFMGVGKIFKAFLIVSLSDQYGKMPWDDLYDGKSSPVLTPKFVDQKTIYENCINLLDEAIADLSSKDNKIDLDRRGGDIMYHGDTEKWIKFAYALKARYLNHYSKKSSLYNPDAIIEACSKAFDGDGMDAEFNYIEGGSKTQANPWSKEGYGDFSSGKEPRYGSFSSFFINLLKNPDFYSDTIDPRTPIIMNPADSTGLFTGIYPGRGFDEGKRLYDYSNVVGGFYSKADSPFPFATYSEVKFIEAEARLRKGDASGAIDAYKEGVLANMRKLGVADSILQEVTSNLNKLTAGDFTANNNISGLSKIMTQKYIAMVFNPETWVDMRRMDYSSEIYPGLAKPENVNPIFEENEWIRAMIYEYNEENRNGKNLGDNRPEVRLKTPVWWDIPE